MRCALIGGALDYTERVRKTSPTLSSAARSARCARAGASLQTSRLTPRSCTAQALSRAQGQPDGAHGRRNDAIASPCLVMRCSPVSPIFASLQWLLHTGCSLEAIDMTVH